MKRTITLIYAISFCILCFQPLVAQEEKKNPQSELRPGENKRASLANSAMKRRDPFKNLLGGQEIKEKSVVEGIPQIYVDDVLVIGIVKARGKYTAIITVGEGFPHYVKAGDKFADGFVLTINDSQVVLRKTEEKGTPLLKPKDIIKEIYPEEQ